MNDTDIKKYKRLLIETLNAFDSFCETHNIKYFACGGTAIGTIRHKGFIPWDDDIDVCMLREDYEKFLSLKPMLANGNFRILNFEDEGYYLPFTKFINTNATVWELKEFPYIIGPYIDIFPLNSIDNDIKRNKQTREYCNKLFKRYQKGIRKYYFSEFINLIKGFHLLTLKEWIFGKFYYRLVRKQSYDLFREMENSFIHKTGEYVMNYYTWYSVEKETLKKDWFKTVIRMPFEDTEINMPNGYDQYLKQLFGDYMKLPPIDKRNSHHVHFYINLERGLTLDDITKEMNTR